MSRYTDSPEFLGCDELKAPIKRVAAIHDLSCLGRCALTVIIPVLSAMGIQTVPVPTALLSTHTGGFENMFFEDLTRHMAEIGKHLRSINTDFDAIYSGFLGSEEQIDTLLGFIKDFSVKNDGKKTFIAVDPVMGDDGELYSTYNTSLMHGMSRLCYGADLITPNLTEACFLSGEKYPQESLGVEEATEIAEHLLTKLSASFGAERTVITGVEAVEADGEKQIITASRNRSGESFFHRTLLLPRSYPGTGDAFASVLLGKLLCGVRFEDASAEASEFVSLVTKFSAQYKTPIRDGLVIEPCLSLLIK